MRRYRNATGVAWHLPKHCLMGNCQVQCTKYLHKVSCINRFIFAVVVCHFLMPHARIIFLMQEVLLISRKMPPWDFNARSPHMWKFKRKGTTYIKITGIPIKRDTVSKRLQRNNIDLQTLYFKKMYTNITNTILLLLKVFIILCN